jgi:alanine racemase
LDVIRRNYLRIAEKTGGKKHVLIVLKANAYGLGAVALGRFFESLGCFALAASTLEEAMELRESGVRLPVLILAPIGAGQAVLAAEQEFWVSLVNTSQSLSLSDAASASGRKVKGHIKADSGLSRLGIRLTGRVSQALEEMKEILTLPGLDVTGFYTHTSDGAPALDRAELELFAAAAEKLKEIRPSLLVHCLSSSTLPRFSEYLCDFARIGALYSGGPPEAVTDWGIEQAVSFKSRVLQVKLLEAGASVSYGAAYVTSRPTKIAVAAVGYADGLRRSLSNGGAMIVRGKKAPIIGKMCCDCTILDVTDIPGAEEGDLVTIWGRDGTAEQYVWDYAELYPASFSEVTAALASRVPRVYMRHGQALGHSDMT